MKFQQTVTIRTLLAAVAASAAFSGAVSAFTTDAATSSATAPAQAARAVGVRDVVAEKALRGIVLQDLALSEEVQELKQDVRATCLHTARTVVEEAGC